ncbi:MAG TPA: hypothetical protein VJL36_02375 [Candidatus Paceibacterota bacterium]
MITINNFFQNYHYHHHRGFAVLYAVLMVSIVLTVSLSLLNITFKQLILSFIARESKIAFYAADSALNCAVYWDRQWDLNTGIDYHPFGYFDGLNFNSDRQQITCMGSSFFANNSSDPDGRVSIFDLIFADGSFAEVKIIKGSGTNGVDNTVTLIRADGYNTTNVNSPRRVQRTLESF